ncbi:MAG: hypothetical protein FJ387_17635 [Verrucomicrobia bacterium]|nr:hypothetical protein [Verrucomicrobiota bacterium]
MNDHGYRPFEPAIGQRYRTALETIVQAFQEAGARVVIGSPGCVGRIPPWVRDPQFGVEDLNLNLCELRNLGLEIASERQAAFADLFWPMLTAGWTARQKYGADYALPGQDGVHPGWAGSFVMAYAFLRAFGLNGEIGTFEVDLGREQARLSRGHELHRFSRGELTVTSHRYPFMHTLRIDAE